MDQLTSNQLKSRMNAKENGESLYDRLDKEFKREYQGFEERNIDNKSP